MLHIVQQIFYKIFFANEKKNLINIRTYNSCRFGEIKWKSECLCHVHFLAPTLCTAMYYNNYYSAQATTDHSPRDILKSTHRTLVNFYWKITFRINIMCFYSFYPAWYSQLKASIILTPNIIIWRSSIFCRCMKKLAGTWQILMF